MNSYQIQTELIDVWMKIFNYAEFKTILILYINTVFGEYIKYEELRYATGLSEKEQNDALVELMKLEIVESLFENEKGMFRVKIKKEMASENEVKIYDPVTKLTSVEKIKLDKKRRRKFAEAFTHQKEIRDSILKRDNYKCVYCHSTENLTIDHIIAITKKGADDLSNLQTLCRSCNSQKNNG